MIEQLKNCPNCAGILNESGRCTYCGSKVYDFLNINFSRRGMSSDKTYIRIKVDDRIILAPVVVNTVAMTMQPNTLYADSFDGSYVINSAPTTEIDLNLMVVGDVYEMKGDKG